MMMFYFIDKTYSNYLLLVFVFYNCSQRKKRREESRHCGINWIQTTTKLHSCFQSENELKCVCGLNEINCHSLVVQNLVRGCGQAVSHVCMCKYPCNIVAPIILAVKKFTEKCQFFSQKVECERTNKQTNKPTRSTSKKDKCERMRQRKKKS